MVKLGEIEKKNIYIKTESWFNHAGVSAAATGGGKINKTFCVGGCIVGVYIGHYIGISLGPMTTTMMTISAK